MSYVVGHNLYGYLPEMEPYAHDDFADAKADLIETLLRFADDVASWAEPHDCDDIPCPTYGDDCPDQKADAFALAAEDVNLWAATDDAPWAIIVGIESFWIVRDDMSADQYNNED